MPIRTKARKAQARLEQARVELDAATEARNAEILDLHRLGYSLRDIAFLTGGVSHTTVAKVVSRATEGIAHED